MSGEIILISLPKMELENLIENSIKRAIGEVKKTEKEKELLNADQICEFLNISLSTLNVWKRENKIPFKRLGKKIFFQKFEVMRALEESNYSKLKELQS